MFLWLSTSMLRLLVGYWVEQNHQIGWKTEQQFKHKPDHKKRVIFTAKKRHVKKNHLILQRIEEVNYIGKQGEYKKRDKASTVLPSPLKRSTDRQAQDTYIPSELDMSPTSLEEVPDRETEAC